MSRPSSRMAPRSGRSAPAIRLKSDVLPAPFGPMMPRAVPSATARSMPSATLTDPKARLRRSSSRIMSVTAVGWAKRSVPTRHHSRTRGHASLCPPYNRLLNRLHLAGNGNGGEGFVVDDDDVVFVAFLEPPLATDERRL